MSGEAKLIIQDLCHHYPDEYTGESVHALEGINLQVYENEFVAIVGPSGCGKTTLLNIVAGLLPYREGRAMVDGNEIHGPGPDRGVVFHLSPEMIPEPSSTLLLGMSSVIMLLRRKR